MTIIKSCFDNSHFLSLYHILLLQKQKMHKKIAQQSSVIYGLGFIGALIYFIQHATSFGTGCLGLLKAIVWPAMLVYKSLELLKM